MTISTTDRTFSSEWHLERLRVWWDRLRAWGLGRRPSVVGTQTAIAVLLLAAWLALPGGFVRHGHKAILLQAALILPLIWRPRAPSLVFSVVAGVAFLQWLTSLAGISDLPVSPESL